MRLAAETMGGGRWSELGSAHFGLSASGFLVAIADQIAVHGVLGHLPPQILIGAIGNEAVEQLLEPLVLGRKLGVELGGGLVAAVHDLGRERLKHGAGCRQPLQRRRIAVVVFEIGRASCRERAWVWG